MDKIVNIGQSIHIKGELTGNEDLTIEGKVEGKVFLKDHNLTVGANGKLVAETTAKTVMVLGEVTGNITADDKVEVAATGTMRGDIHAPRVVLADGAKFKGAIDMDSRRPTASDSKSTSQSVSASKPSQTASSTPAHEPVGAGAPAKTANL
jgi:cytoskeletal protein CcmA (bactofilin family)